MKTCSLARKQRSKTKERLRVLDRWRIMKEQGPQNDGLQSTLGKKGYPHCSAQKERRG